MALLFLNGASRDPELFNGITRAAVSAGVRFSNRNWIAIFVEYLFDLSRENPELDMQDLLRELGETVARYVEALDPEWVAFMDKVAHPTSDESTQIAQSQDLYVDHYRET